MSNTVDRRVVEMQFDNKDFERNVRTSAKSLDHLKKSLNLEESAKGLSALEKAGHKFNLDGMVQAAEAVTSKFSIMGTIGDQVLRRIGDAAFNALNKMKGFVESLTIEPISTGMQEYETQINSIQTILSNTRDKMVKQGLSDDERLEIVNDRLDQLNHYADKTIYNFTEMTRNIGTFTAAGVELDTAVQSIQGIANLAAVSGSTSEQASRGMYQLSQAISTGTVKLMDWNSVVNAGMGGELFQKALTRTAKAMGKTVDVTVTETNKAGKKVRKTVKRTVDELIAEEGSFRESLSKGWLTSDILTATLEQFSWDFEQIAKEMGYDAAHMEEGVLKAMDLKKSELLAQGYTSEEAEEIIQLAKDATEAATKVKTFTQLFSTLKEAAQSGWTQTWEYIIGDFEEAKEMLTGISDFFGKIIESSAEARNQIMKEWHDAGGRDMLWNSDPEKGPLGAFWNLTYGIKNMIDMVRGEFQKIFPPATSQTLLNFTQRIQQATANFKAWTENSDGMDKLRRIVAGIGSALGLVRSGIGYVWNRFKSLSGFTRSAGSGLLDFAAGLGDSIVKMKESIKTSEGFQEFLQRLGAVVTSVRGVVIRAFKQVSTWFGKLGGHIKDSDILNQIGKGISDFVGGIPDAITAVEDWAKSIIEWVKSSEVLKKAWDNVKAFFEPVLKGISDFGKRLHNGLNSLFNGNSDNGQSIGDRLKTMLSDVGSGFGSWLETVKGGIDNAWKNIKSYLSTFFTKTIPEFFRSRELDVGSIAEKLQAIDWVQLINTVFGVASFVKVLQILNNFSKIGKIGDAFNNLSETVKTIAKNGASLTKEGLFINGKSRHTPIGETLLKMAASIGILVASVYVLAKMDAKSLAKGMGMIALLAGEIAAISIVISKTNIDGSSMLKMSAAITLLVIPIKLLSKMPIAKALKGMIGVGLILAELVLAMRLMPKELNGKNAGFIGMSVAINMLVFAVKSLAKMDVGGLAKGLIGLGILMAEMAAISLVISKNKIDGGSMLKMSAAITLLVIPIKLLSNMPIAKALKGMIGVGLILAELVLASRIMGDGSKGNITGLIGMSIAVNVLVYTVRNLAALDIGGLAKGVIGLGILMAEMALFSQKSGDAKGIGGMIGMAIAVNLLATAVKRLGNLKAGTITKGVLSLGGIMTAFGVMTKMTKDMKFGSSVVMLLTLAGTMILFIEAFKQVEGVNADSMLKFAVSLSAIMLALSAAMKIISTIPISGVLTGLGSFAILIAGVGGIIIALGALQSQWEGMTDFLESGGGVLGQIGNAIGKFVGGIGAGIVEGFNLPQLGSDLSAFMINATGFIVGAKMIDSSVVTGVGQLCAAMLAITGTEFINSLLTAFAGNNPITKFTNDLPILGAGLMSYAKSVNGLAEAASPEDLNSASTTAASLAALNTSLPRSGGKLQDWLGTKDLGKFSIDIMKLALGLKSYAIAINGFSGLVKQGDLDIASTIAASLAALNTSLPNTGGMLQKWLGEKDLGKFSIDIIKLADGLRSYAIAINGFSGLVKQEDLDIASTIAASLTALNNSLPYTGGTLQKWLGEKDLGSFSDNIVLLANGLIQYATKISGFAGLAKPEDFASAVDVATNLASLNSTLPSTGGTLQKWLGEKDLGSFATNVGLLGDGLKTFADSIGGVSYEKSEEALGVIDIISKFNEGMTETGGLWSSIRGWFSGEKDMVGLSEKMANVGTNLNTFATKLSTADFSNTESATKLMTDMQTFIGSLETTGGLWANIGEWFGGKKDVVELSGKMATFGKNFGIFSVGITGAQQASTDFNYVNSVITAFGTLADAVKNGEIDTAAIGEVATTIGKSFVTSVKGAIEGGASDIGTAATTLSGAGSTAAEGTYHTWYSSGQYLASGLADGIAAMASHVNNAAANVAAGATRAIQNTWIIHSPSRVGHNLGMNFDLGVAGGLIKYAKVVSDEAANVAAGATRAIQNTWIIHSPSRVGHNLGMNFDLGVAGGLIKYAKVVSDEAANVGASAVESARTMLRGVDGSIFDNLDPNPTIRPVMDLTNIQNGVSAISGMFNPSNMQTIGLFRGMKLSKGISQLNLDGGRITGTFTDKNIISTLEGLQTKIEELGNAVTNMKLILDTGALVGGTSAKMDNELGMLAMRKGRGN